MPDNNIGQSSKLDAIPNTEPKSQVKKFPKIEMSIFYNAWNV